MIKLKIAEMIIQINMPLKLLHDNMCDFLYKGSDEAQIIWEIIYDNEYTIDEKPYICSKKFNIYYKNKMIVYQYKSSAFVPFMIVANEDFSECKFYIDKGFQNLDKCSNLRIENAKEGLFKAFKEMYILGCIYNNRLPLQGDVVLHDDKAYMISSSNKAEKKNLALLWTKINGGEVLNSDLEIIKVDEDETGRNKVLVYGCPWCRNSKKYSNNKALLDGIEFFKQGKENIVYELSIEDMGMELFEHQAVPLLSKDIVDKCIKNIAVFARLCKGYMVTCNNDEEAIKKVYDIFINSKGCDTSER